MATVYKFEIVSHWINYHPNDMKKLIEKALLNEDANEVDVVNLDTERERYNHKRKVLEYRPRLYTEEEVLNVIDRYDAWLSGETMGATNRVSISPRGWFEFNVKRR